MPLQAGRAGSWAGEGTAWMAHVTAAPACLALASQPTASMHWPPAALPSLHPAPRPLPPRTRILLAAAQPTQQVVEGEPGKGTLVHAAENLHIIVRELVVQSGRGGAGRGAKRAGFSGWAGVCGRLNGTTATGSRISSPHMRLVATAQ